MSKAEELAHRIIPIMDENGSWPRMAYREDIMMLLEQYGRLVQEAAAESLRSFESALGDDPAFIGGITKYAPKIIERMPLP